MEIERILKTETSPEDKISMIISNNLDLMFGEKAAVTIDNWKKLGSEILAWHEYEVKKQNGTTIYMPEYEEYLEEQKKAWISTPVKCETGCKVLSGGEVHHHKNCQFYKGSLSEELDNLREQVKKIKTHD